MRKDQTYSLEVTISKHNMNISGAVYSCPAGKGLHISITKMEPTTKAQVGFKKVEDISFSSLPYGKYTTTRIHHKSYDLRPPLMRKTTRLDLDGFLEQLESLPVTCGFVHLLKQPTSFDAPNASLPLTSRSIQTRLKKYCRAHYHQYYKLLKTMRWNL